MEILQSNETPRVPAPVVQEPEYGAAYLDSDETRCRVQNVTKMYPTVELTIFDHRFAGKLHSQADRNSTGDDAGVDDIDAIVAAVAQQYDEPVVTENIPDFEKLGVKTEAF